MANGRLGFSFRMGVTGAIFGAVVTPMVATLFLVVASGGGFSVKMLGAFLFLVAVTATPLGLVGGFLAGIWLGLIGRKCRSRLALTGHGAVAGFALSLLLLSFDWLLHRAETVGVSSNTMFPVAVGTCVGAVGAASFGRILMRPVGS